MEIIDYQNTIRDTSQEDGSVSVQEDLSSDPQPSSESLVQQCVHL